LSIGSSLSSLPLGSSDRLRRHLTGTITNLFRAVLAESTKRSSDSHPVDASKVSLLLSSLSCFASFFTEDVLDLTDELLTHVSAILSIYRPFALGEKSVSRVHSVVSRVKDIVDRDLSRAIVRSATAVAHAALISSSGHKNAKWSTLKIEFSSNWLQSEFRLVLNVLQNSFRSEISSSITEGGETEWKQWVEYTSALEGQTKEEPTYSSVGLRFLWEHGTLQLASTVKSVAKEAVSEQRPSKDLANNIQWRLNSGFRNRHFSHWLHILCAVFRSKEAMSVISADVSWLILVIESMGLDCSLEDSVLTKVSMRPRERGVLPLVIGRV
jgi:hypothetical protein